MLRFKGCQSFRQRLLLSTLTGRAVRIDDIRVSDPNPGLRDFEASFLRLLEKLTNGCVVEISETGAEQSVSLRLGKVSTIGTCQAWCCWTLGAISTAQARPCATAQG
ncbi:putative RNA 3'-terminal phosphate cyclase-like protein, partial [Haematococcus lacustris]